MTNVISELRNTTESSKLYKLRKFLASDYFCALVVLYSVAVICFNWIIPGAFVLALITGFVFFFSDDIVSVFLPIMLIASFGIQANDSLWDYMALAPLGVLPIFAILFHHIFYRERDKSKVKRPGALLLPMVLVSITNFLGGIGTICTSSTITISGRGRTTRTASTSASQRSPAGSCCSSSSRPSKATWNAGRNSWKTRASCTSSGGTTRARSS